MNVATFEAVGLLEKPKSSAERVTLAALVAAFVRRFERPASEGWGMTFADLCLSLSPEERKEPSTCAAAWAAECRAVEERLTLLGKLTPNQRAELERWKRELT